MRTATPHPSASWPSSSESTWHSFCYWYFGVRPILALLLHSQLVLPTQWFPSLLLRFHRWYVGWSGDPLLKVPPTWFQGIVVSMLCLQAPFETFAFKEILDGRMRWLNWAPYYCVHVLTCLVPVFSHLLMSPHPGMDWKRTLLPKVVDLVGVLMLMVYAYRHGVLARIFPSNPILTPPTTPSGKAKAA